MTPSACDTRRRVDHHSRYTTTTSLSSFVDYWTSTKDSSPDLFALSPHWLTYGAGAGAERRPEAHSLDLPSHRAKPACRGSGHRVRYFNHGVTGLIAVLPLGYGMARPPGHAVEPARAVAE
jgi:hypothetical protein